MSAVIRAIATCVATIVVAGCSSTGSTPPVDHPTLPPRPVSVEVNRIPPCTMLTAEQADRLGLRRPTPVEATVEGVRSPTCKWLGSTTDFNVQFIPVGAQVAVTLPGASITQIDGFGAVRNVPAESGSPPICQVAVDVAPGQTIRVQANALPNPPYGVDELCRRADEAASMVMTTVVATVPR